MKPTVRQATAEDAAELGRICYEAFARLANAHGFAPDLPSAQVAAGGFAAMLRHDGFHGLVAELDGRIVGSNFLDGRASIAGIGPLTIEPEAQDGGIGRLLMKASIAYAEQQGKTGVRLVQAAYHCRSLALYSKLGFDVREPLCCVQGPAINAPLIGHLVRTAELRDLDACCALAMRVHGHERRRELQDAIVRGNAAVVERQRRITGYTTSIAFFGHSVGESTEDIEALIGAAKSFGGPGFLVPSRNSELLRWCLDNRLEITQPMTLMTRGAYSEPEGAYLASIYF